MPSMFDMSCPAIGSAGGGVGAGCGAAGRVERGVAARLGGAGAGAMGAAAGAAGAISCGTGGAAATGGVGCSTGVGWGSAARWHAPRASAAAAERSRIFMDELRRETKQGRTSARMTDRWRKAQPDVTWRRLFTEIRIHARFPSRDGAILGERSVPPLVRRPIETEQGPCSERRTVYGAPGRAWFRRP